MKAVFPPADKGAALTCILHLSYTQCDEQNKNHTCQLVPYSEVQYTSLGAPVPPWSINTVFLSAPSMKWCNILQIGLLMKQSILMD